MSRPGSRGTLARGESIPRTAARWTLAGLCGLAVLFGSAFAAAQSPRTKSVMNGLELVYRFASGRKYRARYGAETVHFTLLEPKQADPPSHVLAYSAIRIRDDVFLVAWTDPEFYTTFVVDLERRRIHASALRDGAHPFFDSANLLEVSRTGSGEGKPSPRR